ncbi:WS/DGAT/MGAT family O-acyltransferase [Acanthopleuribacter pedis]|uniref:diacylglycerol O-acyltransferase n=1 Tax=Acanthopleuribacter pedis TaxID=442870 RepID=A0A8J7QBH6_9BACT|nr:wax ester/triacylglycerol synthase family O-acyltransferase [Acanthopleuribacter pedis]MBO1323077.1 wax ester/triacylglycerol synthase family O-acyltransferase [Acanthopleuribacter pedis]
MSATPQKESMSNVDAAWRHMEEPANLMMVSGVMHFADKIDPEQLRRTLNERLLGRYKRFRQKVVDTPIIGTPHWEEDPDFDLENHLAYEVLPAPGDKQALQTRCSQLLSKPLDFERPLWHVTIIDGFGEGNALFMRIHHCIADGIALISVLISLTAESAEASLEPCEKPRPRLSGSGNLFKQAAKAWDTTLKVSEQFVQDSIDVLSQPSRILDLAKQGTQGAATAASLVLKSPDPHTLFRGQLAVPKVASWSEPVPLDTVKRIRKVTNGTVNDVLLAAMAGGLRRYLREREQPTDGLNFRAAVPVNVRPLDKMDELGNQFGLVFLELPIGIEDPLDRLFELKKRMDYIKESQQAVVAFGMLKAVGMTPADIQKIIVNIFGTKTTCVMTNVPGPRVPLYLAGSEISDMMFWVPCSGRVGMGISILSYAGQVRLGIATDAGLVPDPNRIIDGFYREMDALTALADQVADE